MTLYILLLHDGSPEVGVVYGPYLTREGAEMAAQRHREAGLYAYAEVCKVLAYTEGA